MIFKNKKQTKEVVNKKTFRELLEAEPTTEAYVEVAEKIADEALTAYKDGSLRFYPKAEMKEDTEFNEDDDSMTIGTYFANSMRIAVDAGVNPKFWQELPFRVFSQGLDVNELQGFVAVALADKIPLGGRFSIIASAQKDGVEDEGIVTGIDPSVIEGNLQGGISINLLIMDNDDIEAYTELLSERGITVKVVEAD